LRLARTVREPDGLAMSSRNRYMSVEERRRAASLFASLSAARDVMQAGERNVARIEGEARRILEGAGIARIDYAELRRADDLSALEAARGRVILALAAYAGTTRLIDNMVFDVREGAVDADVALY
jgi:pantoate--beta-alanine ligase